MHRWQLLVRCTACGFQVVVPPSARVDVVPELTLNAQRIVNLSGVPLPACRCQEES